MNRALVLTALSFSFLFAAPILQGCSSASDESTDTSASDDLKKSCKGALPDICEICDDGTSACAHWAVVDGKCTIETCPPATVDPNACTTASDCKGLLPDSCEVCADGSDGCAHHVCTAGECGIAYCAAPTDPNACKKDSDCTGPLPDLCKVCSDGSDGCAHHVCSAGECSVSYCD